MRNLTQVRQQYEANLDLDLRPLTDEQRTASYRAARVHRTTAIVWGVEFAPETYLLEDRECSGVDDAAIVDYDAFVERFGDVEPVTHRRAKLLLLSNEFAPEMRTALDECWQQSRVLRAESIAERMAEQRRGGW